MHRLAITLAQLADRANLALALYKAAHRKAQRPAVAAFVADADARLAELGRRIVAGEVPNGRARSFVIHDPKRRIITAACFADRVLHHAILNLAEPRLEQALVQSSYACRPGKGVHAAVQAVQQGLQRHAWCVQVDVAGYFPAIDHDVLLALLARRFKGAGFLALLARIVTAGAPLPVAGGRASGLPIGALTSQHFANAYLDSADRLLLAHRGVSAHVRYMDDIVWFAPSRQAAQDALGALREHLQRDLHLQLKPGVVLRPSALGLRFCGVRVRQGVVLPSARKLARYRQAAQRLHAAQAHNAPESELQRAHDAALAPLAHSSSLHFRQSVWARLSSGAGGTPFAPP